MFLLLTQVPFCKGDMVHLGFDCESAVGYLAVYRLCFALAMFFTLMGIIMLGVKSSKDPRAGIQNGLVIPLYESPMKLTVCLSLSNL